MKNCACIQVVAKAALNCLEFSVTCKQDKYCLKSGGCTDRLPPLSIYGEGGLGGVEVPQIP